jgi:GTP-binding protein EngB required for normal cell division
MLDWDQYQFGCGKKKPHPGTETQSIKTISDYNTSIIILILKMDKVCSFDNGTHLQN